MCKDYSDFGVLFWVVYFWLYLDSALDSMNVFIQRFCKQESKI
ncbi:hypothetical protein [Helicobacter fennelliae]|uniref:Uncharacterized protein n=1 Tax=Helicobacter fennelliae MRY12-0050 TaxID=1325130 RepID=T1CR24_9HELI|nr:hypothetical protein [Helicobacter fennelliae]GAD19199.1 hypothetical protein HFN_0330 [Helicobacter fennelliae MRY12-0050]